MKPVIEYLPDSTVTEAIDGELRTLLTICFTKPQHVVFRDRRYFREPYPNRWVIRDGSGAIVAHMGVHEKHVEAESRVFPIGGIAEVCVHPDHRGRGYVRLVLACIHEWLTVQRRFSFSVLFGNPLVYGSSGYVEVKNLVHGFDPKNDRKPVTAMVRQIGNDPWPVAEVFLPGPTF